jgi:hypothetical protein
MVIAITQRRRECLELCNQLRIKRLSHNQMLTVSRLISTSHEPRMV